MTEQKIPTTEDAMSYKNTLTRNMAPVMYADLPLLSQMIFRRRRVYVIFIAISAVLALIYLTIRPPMFRSEIQFAQPETPHNLLATTVSVAELKRLPLQLFLEYKHNLSSKATQQNFFKESWNNYFPPDGNLKQIKVTSSNVDSDRVGRFLSIKRTWSIDSSLKPNILSGFFSQLLRVEVSAELPERYFFELSIESPSAKLASEIAKDYAEYVNQITITRTINKIHREIDQRKILLENEISKKLEVAKIERENRILLLEEQVLIANSLGYEESLESNFHRAELIPTYHLGAKALESYAEILIERHDDRPFVLGLATLETELKELDKYTKEYPIEQAAHVVGQLSTPHLAGNNRLITVVIALGLGLVAASIYNIFDYYVKN